MHALVRTRAGRRVEWQDTGIRYPGPSTERLLRERRENPGWLYQEVPEEAVARMTRAVAKGSIHVR